MPYDDEPVVLPFEGGTCPKCRRQSWGITWHPEDRALCSGPVIKRAHLHWTCPCGFTKVTVPADVRL